MKFLHRFVACVSTVTVLGVVPASHAQYVLPQMGGGQTGMLSAPMKHADVSFDGTSISVSIDDSVGTPVLRPLDSPFAFDPEQPWKILEGKSYNFQFGWNPGGFISLPQGAWIWVEQLEASPELEVYQRPPALPSYEKIFATDGSIWKWPGAMTHNVYAVAHPRQNMFEATYRVYIGDEDTGAEIVQDDTPVYGSDVVNFRFAHDLIGDFDGSGFLDPLDIDILSATMRDGKYETEFDLTYDGLLSELDRVLWVEELVGTLPGDADLNGVVEFADFLSLASSFGSASSWASGDFDGDGFVLFPDFLMLAKNFGKPDTKAAAIPEPSSWTLCIYAICWCFVVRTRSHHLPRSTCRSFLTAIKSRRNLPARRH